MPFKGCTPGGTACEEFLGRFKNILFYVEVVGMHEHE